MSRTNVPLMALSLLISLMLWFVVIARDLPTEKNLPNKLVLKLDQDLWYVDSAPPDVPLGIQAPGDRLQEIEQLGAVDAEVDITNAKEGWARYPVHVNPTWLTEYLLEKHPSVSLKLERLQSKKMKVEVQLTGKLKDPSLILQDPTPVPSIAKVTAPASMFESGLTRVIARLDQSEVDPKDPQSTDLEVHAVGDDGREFRVVRIEPAAVTVNPILAAAPQTGTALVIPEIVGAPALGFLPRDREWEPTAVQITGDPTVLERTTRIFTEPIDVNGLTADKVFHVKLKVPAQIQIVGPRTVTVTYRVTRDLSSPTAARSSTQNPTGNTFPSTVPPLNGAKGGGP